MILSLKTEYALRALYELAGHEGRALNRSDLAEKQDIPVHYLEHILLALKKAGMVESVKGPGGGYRLNMKVEDINLWNIYRAVDFTDYEGEKCFPGLKEECKRVATCRIKGAWAQLNNALQTSMSSITLQSITR